MAKRPAIFGDRPPSYVSKSTLAAELDMSESTVDSYVQRGLLPKPFNGAARFGGAGRMSPRASGRKPAARTTPS